MPSSPSASLMESGVAAANLQPSAATHDAQEDCCEHSIEEKEEGGGAPRGSSARPPPTAAEPDPTDDVEPLLPPLGGLKLSLLGPYDASKSSPAGGFFSASRYGGIGAVSPCESARSSTSNKGEQNTSLLSDPPDAGAPRLKKQASSTSSSPFLSPRVDTLLHLPRGRSLRFFIDGCDEGLGDEKRSKG